MSVEEMERFAEEYGVVALLDHLGLDGFANQVNKLRAVNIWALEQLRGWWRGDRRDTSRPDLALAELDRMERDLDSTAWRGNLDA